MTDKEPKYGLSVTGLVHPDHIVTKGGARIGDRLILTKPLGVGVITTALKNNRADPDHVNAAVASMSRLSAGAARLAVEVGVHAMTDITGYGLLGHGHEMAHLSGVGFNLHYDTLRFLPGSEEYARQDIFAGGMWRNAEYFSQWLRFAADLPEFRRYLLYDPQTSGGLLLAVEAERVDVLLNRLIDNGDEASVIGVVVEGNGNITVET